MNRPNLSGKKKKVGKKKHTQEQKEAAIARLTLGESPTKIARDLEIPYGTVAYWRANLRKVKEQDGTLGYHAEEKKKFVRTAWKTAQILIKKTFEAAKTIEIKTPTHLKDITSATKTILDRIDKVAPQPPQLTAGKERPLIDLSGTDTKELELIIARFKQIGETTPQLESGEVIDAEVKEID